MGAGEIGPALDVPSVCQNVSFDRMRPEDLVRIRDLSLAEKTRLAYLEGFETEFPRRWNRPPTAEELERALRRFPQPVPESERA